MSPALVAGFHDEAVLCEAIEQCGVILRSLCAIGRFKRTPRLAGLVLLAVAPSARILLH